MNVLLDTHALLWLMNDDENLADTTKQLLRKANKKYVSAVTLWEMAIKSTIGKLIIDFPLEEIPSLLLRYNFSVLPIEGEHALAVALLPLHHKDPFDRLLIAQAQIESLTIISKDKYIPKYGVEVAW